MNIAIIGAGLIGKKRALNLPEDVIIKYICDIDMVKGKNFAVEFNCIYEPDWKNIVISDVEAIFIATTHNWLSPIAVEAIKNGKHVFIEKPGAIDVSELDKITSAYNNNPRVVMFGYNHRYHPAIIKAKEIIDSKKFGKILFVRAKYGHGARLGYEKEWRFDKSLSGGGELIDQGPHLIDLCNYLVGPMDEVCGYTGRVFWNTPLEDTAFWVMKNNLGQLAELSVSCVEWKNIFSFEIMLNNAKIQIDGLGRSYGEEKLTLYKMKPEMGPPDVENFSFPEDDLSWKTENNLFFQRIKDNDFSIKPINDARYVLEIINKIYKLNSSK